ncbi:hypothetical protein [Spirosoma aerophilum]
MNRQPLLRFLLFVQTIALLVYTYLAFQNEGATLFQLFLANIASLTWNGQFNLDFSCYLALSGLWIMWRNKFAPAAIVLGLAAMILGILAFAPYLLYLLTKENGDLKKVLIGDR